jgi:hypothetical protein
MTVNSYLTITFLCLLCFWLVLYYTLESAKVAIDAYAYTPEYFEGQVIHNAER